MTIDPDFKLAILKQPEKEKDKLLLRLLRKEPALLNRLMFQLMDPDSMEERRNDVEEKIRKHLDHFIYIDSTHDLISYARWYSGFINDHIYITSDKYGEAYLQLFMLSELLGKHVKLIDRESIYSANKFCVYVIARVFKILGLIQKLHEDYLLDFAENLEKLGNIMQNSSNLSELSKKHGLDLYWLTDCDIPENVDQIAKDLRARGYLK